MIRWLTILEITLGATVAMLGTASVGRAADAESVLVLRDGGVLQGVVTRSGDYYRVVRANSEVEIAAGRVKLLGPSLAEVYEQQRTAFPRDTCEAHLALARWCLRYDLVPQAARELADARRLDARHPHLPMIERRLRAADSAASRTTPPSPTADESVSAHDEMQRLEAAAADLPDGVVVRFTRKVQPLLVNNCTTAGCHQDVKETPFQLDRAVLHGMSNRRTTLRNLVATLELIDRTDPPASPLLTIPREPHAGTTRPLLGSRQEVLLQQLNDWVAMVTETAAYGPEIATAKIEPPARSAEPAAHFESDEYPLTTLRPRRPLRYGAQLEPWQPRDAFDPEIFNRQNSSANDEKRRLEDQRDIDS